MIPNPPRPLLAPALSLSLAVALIAGFLVYLMYRPMRTPLLMAAATDYAPPWPPNAWAKEDLQGLTVLDRQEVATCHQLSWESNEEGLRQLRTQLDAVRPGGPSKDVVIVYLSVHGAVDAQGRPCLIPPGAAIEGIWREIVSACRELERRMPGRVTTRWWKEERPHGTVFLDYNQNARDRTVASAYSVRPTPNAQVSCPLEWDDLARIYAGRADWDGAIAQYEILTSIGPGHKNRRPVHPIYRYRLAQAYEKKGLRAEAAAEYGLFLKILEKADTISPEMAQARARLAALGAKRP